MVSGLAGKALVVKVHPLAGGGHSLVHDPERARASKSYGGSLCVCVKE